MSEEKRPAHRPITYTKELGEEICLKVSTCGHGLSKLCKENPHWPCRQTIFEWRIKIREFGDNYAKAKQEQIEYYIDEMIDIADDTSCDNITRYDKAGDAYDVCNTEWINRSRVRIDTRKWLASQLAPKVYGDKKPDKDDPAITMQEALKTMRELADKCLKTPT